jgi:hypothetical protein
MRRAGVKLICGAMLLVACLIQGCGKGAPPKIARLDPPKSSRVEALPIPESARLRSPQTLADPTFGTQYIVENVTLKQMNRWYQRVLPVGTAWKSWTECAPPGSPGNPITSMNLFNGAERTWHSSADLSTLALAISQLKSGAVEIYVAKLKDREGAVMTCLPVPERS